jgi:hypothetical protein
VLRSRAMVRGLALVLGGPTATAWPEATALLVDHDDSAVEIDVEPVLTYGWFLSASPGFKASAVASMA